MDPCIKERLSHFHEDTKKGMVSVVVIILILLLHTMESLDDTVIYIKEANNLKETCIKQLPKLSIKNLN